MTERERRVGPSGTEDNVRDELDEAAERGKPGNDASKEAVEEEEATGGVKDNGPGRVGRVTRTLVGAGFKPAPNERGAGWRWCASV